MVLLEKLSKLVIFLISSTINLPKDVSIETVKSIYMYAWELGLKGITIYRDGCRDGVLISDTQNKNNEFAYKDAIKRPKILDGEIYDVRVRGELYNVIVGLLDGKPYEVFVQKGHNTEELENIKIIKGNKGKYNIKYTIEGQEENEKNIAKYIRLKVKIQCGIFGIGVKCKIKSIPPDVTRKMDNQKIDNGRYLLNVVVSKIVPNMMMNVGIKRLNKFWIIDIFMNSLLNLLK